MIDITTVVKMHFVVPGTAGEPFNAHTHGLEKFGHKEFQVLVPGFCRGAAKQTARQQPFCWRNRLVARNHHFELTAPSSVASQKPNGGEIDMFFPRRTFGCGGCGGYGT